MVSISAHATGVIFPIKNQTGYSDLCIGHKISEENKTDRFYTLPIPIPCVSEESYSQWREKLEKNMNMAKEPLKEILNRERDFYSQVMDLKEKLEKERNETNPIIFKIETT